MLKKIYLNYLLKYPKIILFFMATFVAIMFSFAMKLEIDASAETLLLEGDKDLAFTREISKRFEAPNFLVVLYTVKDNLLDNTNIKNIKELSKELKKIDIVESITSIVNVPLLQSPIKPLSELMKNIPTLETKGIDKALVKKEFLNSPIYKDNLVSDDLKTTVISVNLKRDNKYFDLINNRDFFIDLKKDRELTKDEKEEFLIAKSELKKYRDIAREKTHNSIVEIRNILKRFSSKPKNKDIKLHLGGADMISDDMVEFVKSDLETFGIVIVILLILILYLLLKQVRWVVITLFICAVSLIITSGILSAFSWEITLVSSNFISLQLIMNISLVVHLIIKYKELHEKNQNETQKNLLLNTVTSMAKPSFFVVITTMAGFSSLVVSNILPIIEFGWMMSIGIVVSLITTFLLFPIVLTLFEKYDYVDVSNDKTEITSKIAHVAYYYRKTILSITAILVIFSISGASRLKVENSFIDYFKKTTEIYQGMALIDKKLGGTTPLDIVLTFKDDSDDVKSVTVVDSSFDDIDDFEDEFSDEDNSADYWLTQNKMAKIREIHNYLESLDAIGKVLSLATMGEILKTLNHGEEADTLTLTLLNTQLPQKYKKIILDPYLNIEHNQVRISTRVIDSKAGLNRAKLLKKIDRDLKKMINPKYYEYKITNLLVIYNNMLQSLFQSQIKSIGVVLFMLFGMFLLLFRSFKIATVAIIVNTIPVSVIFGFMGWMNIPLDMMTITIASISIGIAVDDTIHYIYRYMEEYKKTNDTKTAIYNSHANIGTAMFYTSVIIIVGFSILTLSSFIPTIYFGLLTMLAMFMAILADLLLLPILLLSFGI